MNFNLAWAHWRSRLERKGVLEGSRALERLEFADGEAMVLISRDLSPYKGKEAAGQAAEKQRERKKEIESE
ncbi:hypothetical protein POX_a01465 [Penicillium oxalicum]|uniref:hypothetical protein n=1 Tax=Penicillium oxalicum TaxID=69781 RepID=UPI0020B68133|nr:hypothetical protein POX_a01465 [Penicillium oxalicum]KAI2794864.1 hypothetical protein POX_a01465 [Penicillium oxalicum]